MWAAIVIVFGAVLGGAAMSSDPQAALASVGLVGGLVLAVVYILAIWIGLAIAAKRARYAISLVDIDHLRPGGWRPVVPDRMRLPQGTPGTSRFGADR